MQFPEFIRKFPRLDIPFPEDVVKAYAVRSDAGLVVFFEFFQDMEIPAHSHLAQWGTVVEGEIQLTINGQTASYGPGVAYDIASGEVHAVVIKAGTKAIDVFEEPDRYPLKA